MGRSFLLAVDESQASQNAAKWCCNTLVGPGDKIYLVTVTPPPTYSVAPAAPIATAGAVAALSMNWEQQRRAGGLFCCAASACELLPSRSMPVSGLPRKGVSSPAPCACRRSPIRLFPHVGPHLSSRQQFPAPCSRHTSAIFRLSPHPRKTGTWGNSPQAWWSTWVTLALSQHSNLHISDKKVASNPASTACFNFVQKLIYIHPDIYPDIQIFRYTSRYIYNHAVLQLVPNLEQHEVYCSYGARSSL